MIKRIVLSLVMLMICNNVSGNNRILRGTGGGGGGGKGGGGTINLTIFNAGAGGGGGSGGAKVGIKNNNKK